MRDLKAIMLACGLAAGAAQAMGQAQAQDAMEMQRCVWACLAGHGPATNPAYHACVEERCAGDGPARERQPAATPSPVWSAGTVDDGRTAYAGVDNPTGSLGLYYFCDRQGRSQLMAAGYKGGALDMTIEAAGERRSLRFEPGPNGLYTDVAPDDPLLAALERGRSVTMTGYGGGRSTLPLAGSSRALSEALGRCR